MGVGDTGRLNSDGIDDSHGKEGLGKRSPGSGGALDSCFGAKGRPTKIPHTRRHQDSVIQKGGRFRCTKGEGDTKNATQNPW